MHQVIPPSGPPTYGDFFFLQTFTLGSCELIKTHLITAALTDGIDTDTCEFTVTVTSPAVSAAQSALCPSDGTASATTVSPGADRGVAVTAYNLDGETMVVTVANYSAPPPAGCASPFYLAGSYYVVLITGAGEGDSAAAYFFYPPDWPEAVVPKLAYWSGSAWAPVLSDGDTAPIWDPTDFPPPPDPPTIGGRMAVVFSSTSTPKITELAGTVFVLGAEEVDTTPPTVICPAGTGAGTDANCQAAVPDVLPGVTATDNLDTSLTLSQDPLAGTLVGLGVTTITVTATDDAGNSSTCMTTFTVTDTMAPTITCPADVTVAADAGSCSASSVALGTPTTGDNCGVARVANDAPSSFPVGVTVVTWTVTDRSGLTATCQQRVTVVDGQAPTITCPADVTVTADAGSGSASGVVLGSPTTSDNCGVASVVNDAPASFPIGVTVVTWTVTDVNGLTVSCQQQVTVVETTPPLVFTGFLPPIGGADATGGSPTDPVRTFKMGSTIPVKFTASCAGMPVLTGVHTLQVVKFSDSTTGDTPIDATPQDAATTGNQFRLADGQWHFNLDTRATGMSVGVWKLVATLSDGSQHSVWVQLK